MPDPVLSVHSLQKVYLERAILEDVTFTVHEGDRVALLGQNGAGKSTLLGIISGKLAAESGEVRRRRDLQVSYLDQEGGLIDTWTVAQTIDSAFAHVRVLEAELHDLHVALETASGVELERLLDKQSSLSHHLDKWDPHTIDNRQQEVCAALGLPDGARIVGQLSGGERRRVALARTLLEDADLLLLDEPTNHLDAETLDWLEDFLARFRGTVIFITHDRYFLDNVATTMIEVARGKATVYTGNYTDYLLAKQVEDEHAAKAESTRQNLLRRELEWMRKQPRARTTKSKSRMDRANDLLANKPPEELGSVQLLIPSGPRLGKTLVEAEKLSYSIGGRTLIKDFDLLLGAGQRIGVVGRNGLGKTTLLRLLMKQLEPESGTVVHGPSVKFVYADQKRESLDPEKTVLEEVAGGADHVVIGDQQIGFRSWLARFLFNENTAAMPIKLLSGGERNRVQLAKMLREGGNIVVLDEPTNDLDLPTLRILEEALAAFEGCAFLVSHDRYFLNRVATRMIGFLGDGEIIVVEGNYDNYREQLQKRAAAKAAAAAPKPAAIDATAPPAARRDDPTRKKLSYKEQRELEAMEETILAAEENLQKIDAKVSDPGFFAKANKDEVERLMRDQVAARAEVERLYSRWEELSARAR
ncbi:ATP-binding cassette domain-containing protein [bacterium]|nr:ATP-binding cassette domain-containing protein [bacterium]